MINLVGSTCGVGDSLRIPDIAAQEAQSPGTVQRPEPGKIQLRAAARQVIEDRYGGVGMPRKWAARLVPINPAPPVMST